MANIEKLKAGNRVAMTEFYRDHAQRVRALCGMFLCDKESADRACAHIFRSIWDHLPEEKIESDAELSEYINVRTVLYCKNRLTKKNPSALKLPGEKIPVLPRPRANDIPYDLARPEQICAALPAPYRFTLVLSAVLGWSREDIAGCLRADEGKVGAVLDVADNGLMNIMSCICEFEGEKCPENVVNIHALLKAYLFECRVSEQTEIAVYESIDSIAAPIEAKKKKVGRTVLVSALAIVIAVCAVFGVFAIIDARTEKIYADIVIEGYGTVTVKLEPDSAPITVDNFIKLAESGFYDGLTFHRIKEGFMMQGGDPDANGMGGSGKTIKGEFIANGVKNYLEHTAGAISMARTQDYDGASSQFFIVHEDSRESLDGLYAVFGYVTKGMDIVDRICTEARPIDNNGMIAADEQPVITSITIRYEGGK